MTLRPATPEFVRLMRIGRAHTPEINDAGVLAGQCPECGRLYPCRTLLWATTDSLASWDPDDEEEVRDGQA